MQPSGSAGGIGFGSAGLNNTESMRQFNYYGKVDATSNFDIEYDEQDLEGLEKEIEHVIRCGTAGHPKQNYHDEKIVNLDTKNMRPSIR